MRKCTQCKLKKDESCFYKDKRYKSGLASECKICHDKQKKEWIKNNREYIRLYALKYNRKYRTLEKYKERTKKYRKLEHVKENNKLYRQSEARKEELRDRYQSEPQYKLSILLRGRLNMALKKNFRSGSAVRDLGCSIEELKMHLEQKFQEGMNWRNHGKWHIDHIKPLSSFDLEKRKEFLKAVHYSNLQPLWAIDNLIKKDKYAYHKRN